MAADEDENGEIRCTKDKPCSNGDCCNGATGRCSRRPEFCDKSVCTSNCDAKPECGVRADKFDCPLNVCCGYWGYCGTKPDFCKSGDQPCQSNCSPGKIREPNTGGDVRDLVIGYYEAWTAQMNGCRVKKINQIDVSSLTHLNVAFGYIKPSSFEVVPMDPATEEDFQALTNLKLKAPGLKVWLSLGGWSFSDNGTETQGVFGDLSSTPAKRQKFIGNLSKFLREWGFDGVDIDWEYPGAPDRGGKEQDTANYVELLKDMRTHFDDQTERWGISFAAPTSYWYLRWFDIENMARYVNWINVMSYDLHGAWDDKYSYIGNYVNSHTNLTEITEALDLMWRANVPANRVNLGIGFYGRTFQLENSNCNTPGCRQKGGASPGPCTDTSGVLSFAEIETLINSTNIPVKHDETAAVSYFTYKGDQWVAYDSRQTLQQKVKYANEIGLLGLMIWAIDLDDSKNSALDALLQPDGLGKFRKRNGVNSNLGDFVNQGASCQLGQCSEKPSCPQGFVKHGHDVDCPGDNKERRNICCELGQSPDEKTCAWRDGGGFLGFLGLFCRGACRDGEVVIVDNDRFWVENKDKPNDGDAACISGNARYCCKTSSSIEPKCRAREDVCIEIVNGKPKSGSQPCESGEKFMSYAEGKCNRKKNMYMPFCCNEKVPDDTCHWAKRADVVDAFGPCDNVNKCDSGETKIGVYQYGDGSNCEFEAAAGEWTVTIDRPKAYCCNANAIDAKLDLLPVPLENLFEKLGPDSNEEKFKLQVESVDGKGGTDPQDNAFGFVIMSGPEKDLTSLDKRDGSHWELFDCENHDKRQTVTAVCTDDGPTSNCGKIFLGTVEETVIELPQGCGAGRYAVAVSMDLSQNQSLPETHARSLAGRGIVLPRKYDLTFDYDFSPIHQRGTKDVLLRIDYSSEPAYWDEIVDRPGEAKREWHDIHAEVERDHGGSWPAYMHHRFRKEKRETPEHMMDEFHKRWFTKDKRWFSSKVVKWLENMRKVDAKVDIARHRIQDRYTWDMFKQEISCTNYKASLHAWVDLDTDVETSATLSLIGNLDDLSSWDQSHVLFRTKGGIQAKVTVDANAELTFTTGPVEVFGAQNFGITFTVPGIVTIGPNFKIIGELSGRATLHAKAEAKFDVAKWDYTQRYPNEKNTNDIQEGAIVDSKGDAPKAGEAHDFKWEASARGAITARITPKVEFGIVFFYEAIPDVTIEMALENSATMYAEAGTSPSPYVCYGINGRTNLYAQVNAPEIFKVNLNKRWDIFDTPYNLLPRQCLVGGPNSRAEVPLIREVGSIGPI
ncbi:glycosyl hydrolases family 18-domain-containing protein [Microdochium trichocladiopsis]|uniref:chitinase n=1 Tax=Microdochium trichocladiopsis TaxID=1682393 RepID=A0A9P8YHX8_9PEZI|nr:glycosyl hydrolases family 18-domain-containing protein [Microdochium trichocladiopsis]KAH7038273.1 glycosyl hydrolases family 18-domain-containing protein [Microdochium trichocladiopsis]